MNYTKEKIIELLATDIAEYGNWIDESEPKDFMGADTFWNSESAKRIGKTTDTKEYFSEVVSEFLIKNGFIEKNNFTGVHQIPKKGLYSPDKDFPFIALGLEGLYSDFSLESKYGIIIESIIPLGNYVKDRAGVVDLITYKKDTNELFIIKVKPVCSSETLLSAVLEIQTYYQTMDKEKLVEQLYSEGKINSNKVKIKKALILLSESNPYNEYKKNYPNVTKIINDLCVEITLAQ